MKILVTGSEGFIGKNLIAELKQTTDHEIVTYTKEDSVDELKELTKNCDFVYHLAGINRPENEKEFYEGNTNLIDMLVNFLEANNNIVPIVLSSSIQAELDNDYGKSKKMGEDILFKYQEKHQQKVYVFRLPNVFGKWSKPFYNSAIATFCYNVARDQEIAVNDPSVVMNLVYIDDVMESMISCIEDTCVIENNYAQVSVTYKQTLGWIAKTIQSFAQQRVDLCVPKLDDELTKKLYSTYLSFLPEDKFSYELKMNVDNRGSFTEFLRSTDRGQVSINISKPGITKGNHWHHTKNEKFLVVHGMGIIRFRDINDNHKVIEYKVSGDKLEVVDIPVGYTHSIENVGETDMVTVMWANEPFDPKKPDTYFLEV